MRRRGRRRRKGHFQAYLACSFLFRSATLPQVKLAACREDTADVRERKKGKAIEEENEDENGNNKDRRKGVIEPLETPLSHTKRETQHLRVARKRTSKNGAQCKEGDAHGAIKRETTKAKLTNVLKNSHLLFPPLTAISTFHA